MDWLKRRTRYHLPSGLQPHNWALTRALRPWLRLMAALRIANVTVVGKHNIPRRGKAIIACNHPSVIDPLYLWAAIPRNATAIAKAELWDMPGVGILLRLLGHIPIVRGNISSAKSTIERATSILDHEGIVLIYPEGGCSLPDGTMRPLKRGIADLAAVTGAPIIPVGIIGSNQVMPQGGLQRLPKLRYPVLLCFGEPINTRGIPKDALLELTRQRILELSTPAVGYTAQNTVK